MDTINSMKQIVGSLKKKNGYMSDRFRSSTLCSERGVFYDRRKVVPSPHLSLSHIEMKKVPIIIFCLQRVLNNEIINFLQNLQTSVTDCELHITEI
jgi:hypothetical protein